MLLSLLNLLPLFGQALAASPDEWRARSVYQVMVDRFAPANGDNATPCFTDDRKYCGGNWNSLASKLDYIQGMGYDAVWISSTTLNMEGFTVYGEAYHGYWTTDPTKLNPHFGTDSDLKALSAALHDRGMLLMVDIALNALASTNGDTSDGALAQDSGGALLFQKQAHYHPKCNIKWGDHDSEMKCWLATSGVSLMDLDQSNPEVGDTLINWAEEYVSTYKIDGFRIDASKHMTKEFQHQLCSSANTFCVGEVAGDNTAYAAEFQGSDALDSVFGFGLLYGFKAVFTGGKTMPTLESKIKLAAQKYSDPTVIGQFLDNQDLPRFNSMTSDKSLVYNAIVGCFLYGGIPMIYYGLEQDLADGSDDPHNREALWLYNGFSTTASPTYGRIANLNKIRKAMNGDDSFLKSVAEVKAVQDQDIALTRGGALIVLTNRGASGSGSWSIANSGFDANSEVVDLLTCNKTTVGSDISLKVTWTTGEPFVFLLAATASSKGLCSGDASSSSSAVSSTQSVAPSGLSSIDLGNHIVTSSDSPSTTDTDPALSTSAPSSGGGAEPSITESRKETGASSQNLTASRLTSASASASVTNGASSPNTSSGSGTIDGEDGPGGDGDDGNGGNGEGSTGGSGAASVQVAWIGKAATFLVAALAWTLVSL